MTNTIKEYINSINFWLKDFEKTKLKYSNYKNDKFDEILESECAFNLNNYQKGVLYNMCENNLYKTHYWTELVYKKDKTKKDIRALKTIINTAMIKAIKNIVEGYSSNNNEIKNFSIKYYINHYDILNNIMSELLKDVTS